MGNNCCAACRDNDDEAKRLLEKEKQAKKQTKLLMDDEVGKTTPQAAGAGSHDLPKDQEIDLRPIKKPKNYSRRGSASDDLDMHQEE